MSVEHPKYWLAYLSDGEGEARDDEITAVAPEILHRSLFGTDAQTLLAAADAYHDRHQYERVVFAAAVTRWLSEEHQIGWDDLDIDFYEALADLDAHAPALMIEASPVARAIVANAATRLELFIVGEAVQDADVHTDPSRAAILGALVRDWAPYINRILANPKHLHRVS
jgi:hypothetical protein